MNVIPTPEQMDAHMRLQWAAWHEQQQSRRQPPRPAPKPKRGTWLSTKVVVALWVAFTLAASLALDLTRSEPAPVGPHLRLDLKTAGVPQ